jgi:hypothetical protein
MLQWLVSLILLATPASQAVQPPADPTLSQLSKVRLDRAQIYSVRDITITRDVLSISLNRGAIAFTEAVDGKVTGAVFVGSGDILAIPPDPIEKKQLFRYTKSALLSERFETAIFRFTDGTWEDVLKEYRRHAPETVDPADVEALLRWESELQRRGAFLNERILADLIGSKERPFFLAQIEGSQLGWFDAVYDERRTEEVFIQQNTTNSAAPLVWASFNKRSDSRDPAATALEDKSFFEIVASDADTGLVRLKIKGDGERVLELPLPPNGVSQVNLDGTAIPFHASGGRLTVILPSPSRSGSEIALGIEVPVESRQAFFSNITNRANSLVPASYRDEWIIEGLANYAAALADPTVLPLAREQLLTASPEGGSNESLGPVWIGFRMLQPRTGPGAHALRNKSSWILYMLMNVMRRDERDPAFGRFVDDVLKEGQGKRTSTFDLKRLAEKHAGKPLDWFFDSWVFGTGIPSYGINSKVEAAANGFVISGEITQSGVPESFEMQVPVYADDMLLGNVMVSNDSGEFRFTSRTMPQQILLDPKRTILRRE